MRTTNWLIPSVVLFTLAACGGGDGGGTTGNSAADAPQIGPHEFGLDDATLNSRIVTAEASIAACMADAGFEYVPVDAVTVREAMNADGKLPGVSDEDFVAQYGFGITTISADPVLEQGRGEQNTRIRDAAG